MKRTESKKQGFGKTILAAAVTVGAVTMAFQGLAQAALAAEAGTRESVSTSYATAAASAPGQSPALPEGYVKQEYTLTDSDLEYYRGKKPAAQELSREEAAEIGVQGLYRVFGLEMGGKTIEMAYNPAQDGCRANWTGSWWVDGPKSSPEAYVQSYFFSVDALSGELNLVQHNRVLGQTVSAGFDGALAQDAGEYEALAKDLAGKLGAVQSGVKAVEYAGQGITNNDPDIFFQVTGEGGERARLQFSRYDKALLCVVFERGVAEMEAQAQQAEAFAQQAEAYFQQNPGAKTYEGR